MGLNGYLRPISGTNRQRPGAQGHRRGDRNPRIVAGGLGVIRFGQQRADAMRPIDVAGVRSRHAGLPIGSGRSLGTDDDAMVQAGLPIFPAVVGV